jgi:DNA-binding transcriptional ArsR family regulator
VTAPLRERPAARHEASPELLTRIAERLKALADPTRLAILHALEARERNVSDLLAQLGGSQANLSKHLGRMRTAGLLAARREGTSVFYRVVDPTAFAICRTVCDALDSNLARERALVRRGRRAIGGRE